MNGIVPIEIKNMDQNSQELLNKILSIRVGIWGAPAGGIVGDFCRVVDIGFVRHVVIGVKWLMAHGYLAP